MGGFFLEYLAWGTHISLIGHVPWGKRHENGSQFQVIPEMGVGRFLPFVVR